MRGLHSLRKAVSACFTVRCLKPHQLARRASALHFGSWEQPSSIDLPSNVFGRGSVPKPSVCMGLKASTSKRPRSKLSQTENAVQSRFPIHFVCLVRRILCLRQSVIRWQSRIESYLRVRILSCTFYGDDCEPHIWRKSHKSTKNTLYLGQALWCSGPRLRKRLLFNLVSFARDMYKTNQRSIFSCEYGRF